MKRNAFTLIELMVSITILSLMMIFLYQSYAALNKSNAFYAQESAQLVQNDKIKEIIYLDYSLALFDSIKILNQEKNEDVVFFQSSNSLHKNYNPYIAYVVNENTLYRLESLKEFEEYPLSRESEFVVDELGEIDGFRVYKSQKKSDSNETEIENSYLIHIDMKNSLEDILLKVKLLNEY